MEIPAVQIIHEAVAALKARPKASLDRESAELMELGDNALEEVAKLTGNYRTAFYLLGLETMRALAAQELPGGSSL